MPLLARRAVACVLALLVLGEVSGVARAYGPGSSVHCCCGEHAAARPCPCAACLSRRVRSADGAAPAHSCLGAGRDCHGVSADDPGVLLVLAALSSPPALAVRADGGRLELSVPRRLRGRAVDLRRPPP
jgi:hypothetical protein